MATKKSDRGSAEDSIKILNNDIKCGTFSGIYLFTGNEPFLIHEFAKKLINTLLPDNDTINFSSYRSAVISEEDVANDIITLPFLSNRRVTLVEGSGFLAKASDILEKAILSMPKENILIFIEQDLNKTTRIYKLVSKNGRVLTFSSPSEKDLLIWITRQLYSTTEHSTNEKIIFSIANGVPELLYSMVGSDMTRLYNEAEKIKSYCIDKKEITKSDIYALISPPLQDKIFELCDAIGYHNAQKVIHLYNNLINLQERPEHILYIITRHYMILLQISEFKENSKSSGSSLNFGDIAKCIGIPPFSVANYTKQLSIYSHKQLISIVDRCENISCNYRNGELPAQTLLEQLIVNLLEN